MFEATGIRLSVLAGIRYDLRDPERYDLNLYGREIRVFGKGGKPRVVPVSFEAARALDRYLRVRGKHPLAGRPELWLGVNGRGPLTPTGVYQLVVKRGEQAGVAVHPQRFRHHFSHTWLDRGGAGGDLMQLCGWSTPQMLTWYGASATGARALRNYDCIMNNPLQGPAVGGDPPAAGTARRPGRIHGRLRSHITACKTLYRGHAPDRRVRWR